MPGERTLRLVPVEPSPDDLVEDFLLRYPNQHTREKYRHVLSSLYRDTGATGPTDLTEQVVIPWATGNGSKLANNSVRTRLTAIGSFLTWCAEEGHPTMNPARLVPLRKQYPRTYGKVQSRNPPRWLDKSEAFDKLIGACQDGTLRGLRDEIAIRLGLAGMRVSEIGHLLVSDLRLDDHEPAIVWTGKGNRPRKIVPGPGLVARLRQYLDLYADALGHPVPDNAPVICRTVSGRWRNPNLQWGEPFAKPASSIGELLAGRAATAGLGHVAPHDLRRTAAGILHRSTADDGAHHFDLLDIQKVLGHADPATTMRSYLDPMDTHVHSRAGMVLDC